ncbi:hypothetical protein LTR97_011772 [Elasticomyces elasticus]|uniref:Uncharacterized protein n=1 Tax=Elasticomyces elasticus TaxID=574655 RepID=A0AAN7ZQS7_9PEZI|nr:hypothetical protein LTR97_011772 [Elasticomyces elasticus]
MAEAASSSAHKSGPFPFTSSGLSTELDTSGAHDDESPLIQHSSRAATLYSQLEIGSYLPDTKWTTTFTSITVLQSIMAIVLGAIIDRKYSMTFRQGDAVPSSYRYLVLGQLCTIVIESVYLVFLSLDCIRTRNIVEAIGVCLNCLTMLLLVGLGMEGPVFLVPAYNSSEFSLEDLYITLLAVLAIGTASASYATWILSREFAWHIADADKNMRKRYLVYETYIALLHLDFFFMLGFWLQLLLLFFPTSERGHTWFLSVFVLAIVGLVGTLLQVLLGLFSARYELKIAQYMTIAMVTINTGLTGPALYDLYTSLDYRGVPVDDLFARRTAAYAGLVIPLLLATIVMAVLCLRNFNKGVKPILQRGRVHHGSVPGEGRSGYGEGASMPLGLLRPRMEIE